MFCLIFDFLENYKPPTPNVHEYQWYHGTLDRNESKQIILQYANNFDYKDHRGESGAVANTNETPDEIDVNYENRKN